MTTKLVRQVTPPMQRVVVSGIVSTLLAVLLNTGWLWLTQNKLNIVLNIPKSMGSDVYVEAQQWQVLTATLVAGIVGTLGALALAKLVIGPRIWCSAIGFGIGLASLYGALTLPGQNLQQHLALALFHGLTTFSIVPALAWALRITHDDLARADLDYHRVLEEAQPSVDATPEPEPEPKVTDTAHDTLIVDASKYSANQPEDPAS